MQYQKGMTCTFILLRISLVVIAVFLELMKREEEKEGKKEEKDE